MASVMIIGWTRSSATPSAVDEADRGRHGQRSRRSPMRPVGSPDQAKQRQGDGADRDDGRDRQVDAAGDDDEGLAGRDEADDGGELDQVAQMADRRRSRASRSWRRPRPARRRERRNGRLRRIAMAREREDAGCSCLRLLRSCGSATAPMMIRPCATYWATGVKPRKNMTLIITLSSRLPASAPRMVPWPPRKPTPPSTAAAIEFSVKDCADHRIARAGLRRDEESGAGAQQAADGIGRDPRRVDRRRPSGRRRVGFSPAA